MIKATLGEIAQANVPLGANLSSPLGVLLGARLPAEQAYARLKLRAWLAEQLTRLGELEQEIIRQHSGAEAPFAGLPEELTTAQAIVAEIDLPQIPWHLLAKKLEIGIGELEKVRFLIEGLP